MQPDENERTNRVDEQESETAEVSQRWECGDCGGGLTQTDFEATDASATTSYQCVECGAEGEVHRSHDPRSPQCYGSVVPK